LEEMLRQRGIKAKIVRCGKYDGDLNKTRKIIEKIRKMKELYKNEENRHS